MRGRVRVKVKRILVGMASVRLKSTPVWLNLALLLPTIRQPTAAIVGLCKSMI